MKPIIFFLAAFSWLPSTVGAADPPPSSKADAAANLSVLTFNIRFDNPGDGVNRWSERSTHVAKFINGGKFDIIGMQEAKHHQLGALLKKCGDFRSIGVGRDDGKTKGEYAAILYRHSRLDVLKSGTFWFSSTPEKVASNDFGNEIPRICTWARFKIKETGRTFYVYNVHLDHQSQPSREKSVELLMKRAASRGDADPIVITGDFNADESNKAILSMTKPAAADSMKMLDTFRVSHPDTKEVGTFNGFKGTKTGGKIDYVFVEKDGAFKVIEARIHRDEIAKERNLSDHYPVGAVLRLASTKK